MHALMDSYCDSTSLLSDAFSYSVSNFVVLQRPMFYTYIIVFWWFHWTEKQLWLLDLMIPWQNIS